jgi:hypothetical protein
MGGNSKAILKRVVFMGEGALSMEMEIYTGVILNMGASMEKEFSFGKTVIHMLVNFATIDWKDMEK